MGRGVGAINRFSVVFPWYFVKKPNDFKSECIEIPAREISTVSDRDDHEPPPVPERNAVPHFALLLSYELVIFDAVVITPWVHPLSPNSLPTRNRQRGLYSVLGTTGVLRRSLCFSRHDSAHRRPTARERRPFPARVLVTLLCVGVGFELISEEHDGWSPYSGGHGSREPGYGKWSIQET